MLELLFDCLAPVSPPSQMTLPGLAPRCIKLRLHLRLERICNNQSSGSCAGHTVMSCTWPSARLTASRHSQYAPRPNEGQGIRQTKSARALPNPIFKLGGALDRLESPAPEGAGCRPACHSRLRRMGTTTSCYREGGLASKILSTEMFAYL